MIMHADRQAAIIANDLDSLIHRIETLPPHPEYTAAQIAVGRAKLHVQEGQSQLHHEDMKRRHAQRAG